MIKTFLSIIAGALVAVPASAKMTLINTGSSPISLVDAETDAGLADFDESAKSLIIRALSSIEPGKAVKLLPGTYRVDFGSSLSGSAVVLTETKVVVVPPADPAQ